MENLRSKLFYVKCLKDKVFIYHSQAYFYGILYCFTLLADAVDRLFTNRYILLESLPGLVKAMVINTFAKAMKNWFNYSRTCHSFYYRCLHYPRR